MNGLRNRVSLATMRLAASAGSVICCVPSLVPITVLLAGLCRPGSELKMSVTLLAAM